MGMTYVCKTHYLKWERGHSCIHSVCVLASDGKGNTSHSLTSDIAVEAPRTKTALTPG